VTYNNIVIHPRISFHPFFGRQDVKIEPRNTGHPPVLAIFCGQKHKAAMARGFVAGFG
jgi:hypothetical protein